MIEPSSLGVRDAAKPHSRDIWLKTNRSLIALFMIQRLATPFQGGMLMSSMTIFTSYKPAAPAAWSSDRTSTNPPIRDCKTSFSCGVTRASIAEFILTKPTPSWVARLHRSICKRFFQEVESAVSALLSPRRGPNESRSSYSLRANISTSFGLIIHRIALSYTTYAVSRLKNKRHSIITNLFTTTV